jgi:uncharacterized protein with ATP-grasp and redox domains
MAILTDSRCLLCHFNKNIDTARGLGSEAQATSFARELMKIYLDSPADVGATWYGPATAELFDRIYGVGPDRFLEEKRQSNAFVLDRMEQIRQKIDGAEDRVLAGLKFAILGNYIDFSALYGEVSFQKLDGMLETALEMKLDTAVYHALCRDLQKGGKLLYLTDNAGEIGFDRLFAEAIHNAYPQVEITFCVRGGPALNDATREDARQVGIPFPVIDNGNLVPGTELKLLGEEAKHALETADLIIAKCQANAETLLDSGYNIYFAFLIKCVRFMERYNLPKLTPMLVKERN